MSLNHIAIFSSGEDSSTQGILVKSTDSQRTTTNQSDSLSSLQVDESDTDLSSYPTCNGSQIGETLTPTLIRVLTPPIPHGPSSVPSAVGEPPSSIKGSPADPTYATQFRKPSQNNSVYPPLNSTDISQLPPSVPVWRPNQSQPNLQAQSATSVSRAASPANSIVSQGGQQLPSQYSHESYRIPTAQIPQTYSSKAFSDNPTRFTGASRMSYQNVNSDLPPLPPEPYVTPRRRSALGTPSTYSGMPSQSSKFQSAITPQSYSSGPVRLFQSAPPSFYGLPGASTPQAQPIHGETHQPFVSQVPGPQSGVLPSPYIPPRPLSFSGYNPITQTVKPRARKVNAFVASDPFRVSHDDEKADAPSDGLTFDDIPTASSNNFCQGMMTDLYESFQNKPTFGGNHPDTTPPPSGLYGQSHSSTQTSVHYPPASVPTPHRRSSWAPEPFVQTPTLGSNTSGQNHISTRPSSHLPSAIHMQTKPPTPVSSQLVQSQAPVSLESPVPSTRHSPSIGPKPDDIVTPFTAVPAGRPTTSSHPEEIPFNQNQPQMEADEISLKPTTVLYEYKFAKVAHNFLLVTCPTQIYLHFLLRLPSLYFSRVARIFEEADMTLPELKRMALETASQGLCHDIETEMAFESSTLLPAYRRLTSTWESFIDSVMLEWKTFNIISVLLLTAILSILQIPSAAGDPLTRYTALFSLVCALMSLIFGCMYIIRFGNMRKTYKAAEWALEAKRTKTFIWWNVWVLLAMPAIWLTWSIILYTTCIMSFVWRSGVTNTTPPGISDTRLLVMRMFITIVLVIGMTYGFLIMTTFRRYGLVMDRAWKQRIDRWIEEKYNSSLDQWLA